jgi:hypothetical protein
VANAFISQVNKRTIQKQKPCTRQHCYVSLKPYTLTGFEPGYPDPEADEMPTSPRRYDYLSNKNRRDVCSEIEQSIVKILTGKKIKN